MATDNREWRDPEVLVERIADKISERVERGSANAARRVEKISEKMERGSVHAARRAEQLERQAAKAARKAEALERVAARIGTLDVWTRVEPAARRPRFTREEIAVSAMRIADAEGF